MTRYEKLNLLCDEECMLSYKANDEQPIKNINKNADKNMNKEY